MEDEEYYVEEMEEEGGEEREKQDENKKVFIPGKSIEGDNEGELEHDRSAYHMYHTAQTGAPCLSFDILRDELGEKREEYPMTAYIVGGTQAERGRQNFIVLMKMSQLCSTFKENDDDDDEDDDEEEEMDDEEPQLDTVMIQHPSTINRLRIAPLSSRSIVATWSESSNVHIWDISKHSILLDSPSAGGGAGGGASIKGHKEKPLFTFNGHQSEGYAIDWSKMVPGKLATGDNHGNIHLWMPQEGGTWAVDQRPYSTHTKSVEDIQWSPNENTVFASCSVDGSIRIWDSRAAPTKACMITMSRSHDSDVNVIHWNPTDPYILSGGDDGVLKVWDLRLVQRSPDSAAVVTFKHHTKPVSSVEWHPSDSTVFASAGEDNQIVQWDLSVERDEERNEQSDNLKDIPPQLLFIHQGQEEIKELHWHPQLPGVIFSTAQNGFNIFKTISV